MRLLRSSVNLFHSVGPGSHHSPTPVEDCEVNTQRKWIRNASLRPRDPDEDLNETTYQKQREIMWLSVGWKVGLHFKPPFLFLASVSLQNNFRIVGDVRVLYWEDWPAHHKGKNRYINRWMHGWMESWREGGRRVEEREGWMEEGRGNTKRNIKRLFQNMERGRGKWNVWQGGTGYKRIGSHLHPRKST